MVRWRGISLRSLARPLIWSLPEVPYAYAYSNPTRDNDFQLEPCVHKRYLPAFSPPVPEDRCFDIRGMRAAAALDAATDSGTTTSSQPP
jgi:hypothetical protein